MIPGVGGPTSGLFSGPEALHPEENQLYEEYRESWKTLKLAISRGKDDKRKEMMESHDCDPWDRLYHVVRKIIEISVALLPVCCYTYDTLITAAGRNSRRWRAW